MHIFIFWYFLKDEVQIHPIEDDEVERIGKLNNSGMDDSGLGIEQLNVMFQLLNMSILYLFISFVSNDNFGNSTLKFLYCR